MSRSSLAVEVSQHEQMLRRGKLLMALPVYSYNWSLISAVWSINAHNIDRVERRMARIRSESPVGGSIDTSKVFLTT